MLNAADWREFRKRVAVGVNDSREKSLVLTKLEEAEMWYLKARNKEASNG